MLRAWHSARRSAVGPDSWCQICSASTWFPDALRRAAKEPVWDGDTSQDAFYRCSKDKEGLGGLRCFGPGQRACEGK